MTSVAQQKSRKTSARNLLVASSAAILATSGALAQEATQPQAQQEQQQQQIAQQCLEDLRALESELQATAFGTFRPGVAEPTWGPAAPPADPAAAPRGAWGTGAWGAWGAWAPLRQEMRDLRRAAHVMAARGNDQGCQAVVEEIRAMHAEWQQQIEADPDQPMTWRRGLLEAALPAEEAIGVIRAQDVIGADVRNLQDEHLGNIDDVVLDPSDQTIRYVLIARGGFLGIGDELIPVRWEDLQVTPDRLTFVLNVPEMAVQQAPSADDPQFFFTADEDWWQQVEQYWDQTVAG